MKGILERFGVGPELFESQKEFESLTSDIEEASIEAIKNTLEMTVPQECGHRLIRIGNDGGTKNFNLYEDGQYLLPDDLEGIEACFSPGVANRKGFEDELVDDFGIKTYMCDFSSEVSKFETPIRDSMQFFEKLWLDIDGSENSISIEDWVNKEAPGESDLILQMDIEGAEYRNIIGCPKETLSRFRIIVLEIHSLQLLPRISFLEGIFRPFLEKIVSDFECVHAHPNNCCGVLDLGSGLEIPRVLELTFLRKDRFRDVDIPLHIPNPLDIVNVQKNPPLYLGNPWNRGLVSLESKLLMFEQKIRWLEYKMNEIGGE